MRLARLTEALGATWPPAALHPAGPFTVGEGQGGGQRVASARVTGPCEDWPAAITAARQVMAAVGQPALFHLDSAADRACDAALAAMGYGLGDRVILLARPLDDTLALDLAADPAVSAQWPPAAAQAALWAKAGIGPARLAVMARTRGPRAALALTEGGALLGTVFVACDGDLAGLHALEVAPAARRQGVGRRLTLAACHWAATQGAQGMALWVLDDNAPARALYAATGFTEAARFHYRREPQA